MPVNAPSNPETDLAFAMGKIRIEAISFFWKSLKKPLICGLLLLNCFWLVHNTGHAEEAQVSFDPESYVGQMLMLFKTSELMEDIWIDYIQKRASVYRETADQMDRYPMLANLDYVGKAHDYSYDFLAMQAVRCQRYRELLQVSQDPERKDPEHDFQAEAFKACVSLLYTKIREALVDLKLKKTGNQK